MKRFYAAVIALMMTSSLVTAEGLPASVLQDLIDAAAPGDEVVVPAGVYHGVVQVKDGVFLRGAGDGETFLDGQGAAEVVVLGKHSAIIGFTVRNGKALAVSRGNFVGVFECSLQGYTAYAVSFQGGAGVIAHNVISGAPGKIGILCGSANPLIVNNLIESNQVGLQVHPHLIPTVLENLFVDNVVAIALHGEAHAVIERNLFDGNGQVLNRGEPSASNNVRPVKADEFVMQRGVETDAYRDLMRETASVAVKDHPLVIYDLQDEVGAFDVLGLFPWATFTLSASALDTRIERYHAYDVVKDTSLHAEYFMQNEQRPSVRVNNPELVEKMRERYVLENRYQHPGSYFEDANGLRVFKRHTNVSQIEIVLPTGYELVFCSPEGVLHDQHDRPYISITDMGDTHLELVMQRIR